MERDGSPLQVPDGADVPVHRIRVAAPTGWWSVSMARSPVPKIDHAGRDAFPVLVESTRRVEGRDSLSPDRDSHRDGQAGEVKPRLPETHARAHEGFGRRTRFRI